MRVNLTILSLAAAALLAGCASTEKYEAKLRGWVGKPAKELYAAWGPPTRSTPIPGDGGTSIEYARIGNTYVENDRVGNQVQTSAWTQSCTTSFILDSKGVIQHYRYNGNTCVSE